MELETADSDLEEEVSKDGYYQRVRSTQTGEVLRRTEFKVTYRAINHETGCQVSWHEVDLRQLSSEALAKAKEELARIRRLQHGNIISWLDLWYKPETCSMVYITELIPDGSLRQCLIKTGTPRVKVLRQWLSHILEGLQYLHSQTPPITHGSLTLDNLYVIPHRGVVKIGGLWRSAIPQLFTSQTGWPEHPECMAPELLKDMRVPAVDVYSVGMCLLEMCTKEPPYQECVTPAATIHRVLNGKKPLSLGRIADTEVTEFIEQCLKPLPDRSSAALLLSTDFICKLRERTDSCIQLRTSSSASDPDDDKVQLQVLIPATTLSPARKISFHFDLQADSADNVAAEMVKELELPEDMTPSLSREISERVYQSFTLMAEIPTASSSMTSVSTEDEGEGRHTKPEELESWPKPSADTKGTGELCCEEVKQLQTLLSERFDIGLSVNGVFNKKTEAIVRRVQEELGEEVTGLATARLLAVLQGQKGGSETLHKPKDGFPL